MTQGDLFDAWGAAEEGMNRAADHAERVEPGWGEAALSLLQTFAEAWARTHSDPVFMAEDVRAYADERGFSKPPDNRAWGKVMVRAKKDGLIVRVGLTLTKRPSSHRRPQTAWRPAGAEPEMRWPIRRADGRLL